MGVPEPLEPGESDGVEHALGPGQLPVVSDHVDGCVPAVPARPHLPWRSPRGSGPQTEGEQHPQHPLSCEAREPAWYSDRAHQKNATPPRRPPPSPAWPSHHRSGATISPIPREDRPGAGGADLFGGRRATHPKAANAAVAAS